MRDLQIDEPAYYSAQKDGYHAPETHSDKTSELIGRMKRNQNRSQCAKKNMKFKTVLQQSDPQKETIPLTCHI